MRLIQILPLILALSVIIIYHQYDGDKDVVNAVTIAFTTFLILGCESLFFILFLSGTMYLMFGDAETYRNAAFAELNNNY